MPTWCPERKALEDARTAGKTKAIGVSNFDVSDLRKLKKTARALPPLVTAHARPLVSVRKLAAMHGDLAVIQHERWRASERAMVRDLDPYRRNNPDRGVNDGDEYEYEWCERR